MNILSQKWANISYICKKCFPDFAKGYSSDNDFVNCSEISVVTWTINHVRLLQFPKKCVFTPLYCWWQNIQVGKQFHPTRFAFLDHLTTFIRPFSDDMRRFVYLFLKMLHHKLIWKKGFEE